MDGRDGRPYQRRAVHLSTVALAEVEAQRRVVPGNPYPVPGSSFVVR